MTTAARENRSARAKELSPTGPDIDDAVRSARREFEGGLWAQGRPTVSMALDGRPLVTRPIAGGPRPMIMGLARLNELCPTRLVDAFEQHCRTAIAEKTMPGPGDDS